MIDVFMIEKMNQSIRELSIKENTNKMIKTVQDLKEEMQSTKKAQSKENLRMENLETWTGNSEASLTERIQAMDDKISGIEDRIEWMTIFIKENVKSKNLQVLNIQKIWNTIINHIFK